MTRDDEHYQTDVSKRYIAEVFACRQSTRDDAYQVGFPIPAAKRPRGARISMGIGGQTRTLDFACFKEILAVVFS